MRRPEFVIKSPEQNGTLVIGMVRIYTKQLFRKLLFLNSVVIIKPCLRRPTDMEGGMNMGLTPLHNLAQLMPIIHILKFHMFHRSTGDDHTIEFSVLQLIKGLIKRQQMLFRCIF